MKYTLVNNFRCKKCQYVCISLDAHDYIECDCGNFTDGGDQYWRRGGNSEDMETLPLYLKKVVK